MAVAGFLNSSGVCLLLRRFDFSRKTGEAGELEARETGDEHARDQGKEKGERPLPFLPCAPTNFAARETSGNEAVIVRVRGVLKRTVVGDCRFDNLS